MIVKRGNSYGVRVYNPVTKRKEWIGSRSKLRGPGGALELERETEQKYAGLEAGRIRPRSCAELADRWIADRTHANAGRRWKTSTEQHNRERIRAFLDDFGDRRPDEIPREEAMEWAREHPRNVDQARAMINHGLDLGLCRTNPLVRPGTGKGPGRQDDPPLTSADLAKLQEACATLKGYADQMRGWITFAAYVGCRPAEGLGLKRRDDVDLGAEEVHVRRQKYRDASLGTPKNGRPRTIILPEPAREALSLIPVRTDSPWLFHGKQAQPLLYGTLLTYWSKVTDTAGLTIDPRYPEGIDPYHLRHFCGSHLADLGCSAQDIALQLGHTDGGKLAQELYIHTYEDRARARLKAAYGQNVKPILRDAKETSG